jgi:2-hydroxychromene-2-carboxylate isomerase
MRTKPALAGLALMTPLMSPTRKERNVITNQDGISYSTAQLAALFQEADAEHKLGVRETIKRVAQRTGLEQSQLARHANILTILRMAAELKRRNGQ